MNKETWKKILELYQVCPSALCDDIYDGIERHESLIREWIESDKTVKICVKGDWHDHDLPQFSCYLSYKLGTSISP